MAEKFKSAHANAVAQLVGNRELALNAFLSYTGTLHTLGVQIDEKPEQQAFIGVAVFDDETTMPLLDLVSECRDPEFRSPKLPEVLARGLEHLVAIGWCSTFDGENDNEDRKIKVILDWKSGLFTFENVPGGAQGFDLEPTDPATREPVLSVRGFAPPLIGKTQETAVPVTSTYHWDQFVLGYRVLQPKNRAKERANEQYAEMRLLVIDPLGRVEWLQK